MAGTRFLCREAELAGTRASLVEFGGSPGDSSFRVTWRLPSSKTDGRAVGTSRAHFCRCGAAPPLVDCVVHALADQVAFLRRQFPRSWSASGPSDDLPLFPSLDGCAPAKCDFVRTFTEAAIRMGCATTSADGSRAITGHSLRVGGAQGLARRGVELWAIQLMGRWGGETVRRYLADSHLDAAARRASSSGSIARGWDLDLLLTKLKEKEASSEAIACPAARAHLALEVDQTSRLEVASENSLVAPKWVTNFSSGICHKVLPLASSAEGLDITYCGWKFGGRRDAGLPVDRQPTVYRQVCARCDPALRASLKAAA